MVGVGKGKFLQPCKFRLTQLGAQSLAEAGRKNGRALAKHKGDQGEEDHLRPLGQNVMPVPVCNSHIYNRSHYKGNDQLKDGLCDDAEGGNDSVPPVGTKVREKFFHIK